MMITPYQCEYNHEWTVLIFLKMKYYHLKNNYTYVKGRKSYPLLNLNESMLTSFGLQGRSRWHKSWYHLLGFMVSAVQQILEHLRKSLHRSKYRSWTNGGKLIQRYKFYTWQCNQKEERKWLYIFPLIYRDFNTDSVMSAVTL